MRSNEQDVAIGAPTLDGKFMVMDETDTKILICVARDEYDNDIYMWLWKSLIDVRYAETIGATVIVTKEWVVNRTPIVKYGYAMSIGLDRLNDWSKFVPMPLTDDLKFHMSPDSGIIFTQE